MIDDPMIGRILGPNLTTGRGSRTLAYTPADWDRTVRHGVKPDGTPTPMPSKDFVAMSDRELSDVVTYIRSLPPVDAEVPAMTLGPLGMVLLATGQIELSATVHPDHHAAHAALPPAEAPDAEFGEHIAQVCVGCHRGDFTGGPIVGGDPSWPAAADLTALDDWTYQDFATALREGRKPDGTALRAPMAGMSKMAANMSETELRAMWAFLQTLPASAAEGPPQG
jgi:mono/diheme cytochrome c family protein